LRRASKPARPRRQKRTRTSYRLNGSLEHQWGNDLRVPQVPRSPGCSTNRSATGIFEGALLLAGSRIQDSLPPVTPAPAISIRKHRKQGVDGWPALTLDDYELSPLYRRALHVMAEERRSVLIVGSTGSGKSRSPARSSTRSRRCSQTTVRLIELFPFAVDFERRLRRWFQRRPSTITSAPQTESRASSSV
jgi:hypothetical protein